MVCACSGGGAAVELISILSLFIPLVTGPHPVELAVADRVARVELLLDGQQVAELSAPPWIVWVDGAYLPQEIELGAADGKRVRLAGLESAGVG